MESFVLPNGEKVEFFPETHTYVVRGEKLPSITELLTRVHGDKYGFVDQGLLERSAEYGTKVHQEIQTLIDTRECGIDIVPLLEDSTQETKNYFVFIEQCYEVVPIMTEKVVVLYDREGTPIAAGRFDLACKKGPEQKIALCDFKTTSSLNTKMVSDQLNLYKIAAEQSGYFKPKEISELAAIHLSGSQCKMRTVQIFGEKFYDKYIAAALQKR